MNSTQNKKLAGALAIAHTSANGKLKRDEEEISITGSPAYPAFDRAGAGKIKEGMIIMRPARQD